MILNKSDALPRGRRDVIPWLGRVLPPEQKQRVKRAVAPALARKLDMLALLYGTDKSSHFHGYTRLYDSHFHSIRRRVRRVLEIGVGGTDSWSGYDTPVGGQSLQMWKTYFPQAEIIGVDIHPKNVTGERVHFEQGDQADAVFLQRLIDKWAPFDIVIDDGSHLGRHIRASFEHLWAAVRPGGYYVIEDLSVSYHPDWEGGPPGTPGTGAEFIKEQIDRTLGRYGDESFDPAVAELHLYADIVFLRRPGDLRL